MGIYGHHITRSPAPQSTAEALWSERRPPSSSEFANPITYTSEANVLAALLIAGDTYFSTMRIPPYLLPSNGWPVQGYAQLAIAIGATSLVSTMALDNGLAGKIWLAIGAYSPNCEIVQFTAAVGGT